MMAEVDTRWFQDRLADKRLSQRKLASMMNLDPAAMSLMIRGKRKMSGAEAAEIAKFIGVSVDEVLVRAGATPTLPARHSETPVETPKAASPTQPSTDLLEVPVPTSDGNMARLLLPRGLTKADAERIAALVMAFSGAN